MDVNILVSWANLNLINEVAISSNIFCRLLTDTIGHSCPAFCVVRWNYSPRTGDESAAFDRKTSWYSWGRSYEVGKKCQGILDFWRIPAFKTEALWWCTGLLNCCSPWGALAFLCLGRIWYWTLSPWKALCELDVCELDVPLLRNVKMISCFYWTLLNGKSKGCLLKYLKVVF